LSRGARGARADPDEDAVDAGGHQLEGRLEVDGVADEDRDRRHLLHQLVELEALERARDVARRGDRGGDDEEVDAGRLGDWGVALGILRGRGDDGEPAPRLDLLDTLRDQIFLYRRAVDLLDK